jgi:dTDP-4-dehydrorhamnose 3,5-epimerase
MAMDCEDTGRMKFLSTELSGVILIEPDLFEDDRGFFMETYHRQKFAAAGIDVEFVQDNHSRSRNRVLRGLHYQLSHPQGKLVRAVRGEIFDVAVDLRRSSPAFGRWCGYSLSETNRRMLYIPPGFAHGFCTLSDTADVVYKCSDFYDRAGERTLRYDDPQVAINWPIAAPIVSTKDAAGLTLEQAPTYV